MIAQFRQPTDDGEQVLKYGATESSLEASFQRVSTMAFVVCTPRLHQVGPIASSYFAGADVAAVLRAMHHDYPQLTHYLLDDQGRVRQHLAIFVDGVMVPRQSVLQHPAADKAEIYIMQALSGG